MNDEHLETMLRDALEHHGADADPDRARALARQALTSSAPSRTRRWLVPAAAAAAAAVVVIGTTVGLVGHGGHHQAPTADPTSGLTTGSTSSPAASPTTETYAANRALAADQSHHTAARFAMPEGSSRLDGEPESWPSGFDVTPQPLLTTVWWRTPLSSAAMLDYLRALTTSDLAASGLKYAGGWGSSGSIQEVDFYQPTSPTPMRTAGTSVRVSFVADGSGTLVRLDARTSARAVRPALSYVDGAVSATVQVERQSTSAGNSGRDADSGTGSSVDDSQLTDLIDATDALPPSVKPPIVHGCPLALTVSTYTVEFALGAGQTVQMKVDDGCTSQISVTRNGTELPTTLEPSRAYLKLLRNLAP